MDFSLTDGNELLKKELKYYSVYDYYQYIENTIKYREQISDSVSKSAKEKW